jgi:hypothetical protein
MPTNLTEFIDEFIDDTASERYILNRVAPLLPRSQGTAVIEYGEGGSFGVTIGAPTVTARVQAGDSTGTASGQLSRDDIRPLLFLAAWKVLDQLCELALEEAGECHDQGWRYSNDCKSRKARTGRVTPRPPFGGHPDLWARIMSTYASTGELRNSLVHGGSGVDPRTGAIRGAGKPGQPAPRPVTSDEQSAFCQVAVGAAEAVIEETLPSRQRGQLAWALNQLTSHHGQPPLNTSPVHGLIPRVSVSASPGSSNDVTLDFADIRSCARAGSPDASHYDVEIRLPDGRTLVGALEEAPTRQASFNLANPPGWLRRG